ncbi:MAG: hypothetical protein HY431_00390 [Candidatus Levybacteria bacterium]|nr:hypothetical protein [Candidatus Levybacteria bacterium]
MSKKTIGLIIGLLVTTGVLLFVALSAKQPTQPRQTTISNQPTPTPVEHSTLSFSPNPAFLTTATTGTVDVMIATGVNEVKAVQLELSYDPEALSNVTITPGEFFPTPIVLINEIDRQTGQITYALGLRPSQVPVTGIGKAVTIRFTKAAGATGMTEIEILPKSLVTAKGVYSSVLKSATGVTINLATQVTTTPTQ